MTRIMTLTLSIIIVPMTTAQEKKQETDPYAELFSFPAKIVPSDEQKDKLADLRKALEPTLKTYDKLLKTPGPYSGEIQRYRDSSVRLIGRKKNLILTEEQRKTLGIRIVTPFIANEKNLSDPKIWDLAQLERIFTIESRTFDYEEYAIAFMVITKRKWTDNERQTEASPWLGGNTRVSPIEVIFYNKNEEKCLVLTGPFTPNSRSATIIGNISRAQAKLTDKQAEEGLQRFRIKVSLDSVDRQIVDAASAKFVCPDLPK